MTVDKRPRHSSVSGSVTDISRGRTRPIGAQNDALCGHQGSRIHARDSAIGSLRRTVLVALRNQPSPGATRTMPPNCFWMRCGVGRSVEGSDGLAPEPPAGRCGLA